MGRAGATIRAAMRALAVIRGGGELGTGIGHALALAGLRVVVLDRPLPGALRLGVAFAAAAVKGRVEVEGVVATLCADRAEVDAALARGEVAVWTGRADALGLAPDVLVDARMRSLTAPMARLDEARVVIGVGPGIEAGKDAHFVIESNRGPRLGEALREGRAEAYTGVPGDVLGVREPRILRSPVAGRLERVRDLGDAVEPGDVVATVAGAPVVARIAGMIRGLKLTGVEVGAGHKVGDVDPRRDRALLGAMTDKAKAVGRGALGALEEAGVLAVGPSDKGSGERGSIACT
jgi:xanthine dehydrogenase accessory factor